MLCLTLSCFTLAFSVQFSNVQLCSLSADNDASLLTVPFVLDTLLKQDCAPHLVQGAIYVSSTYRVLGQENNIFPIESELLTHSVLERESRPRTGCASLALSDISPMRMALVHISLSYTRSRHFSCFLASDS